MTNDGSSKMRKNAFRKFLAVYQRVTSAKCIFFESNMYFSVVSWDICENCCNFAVSFRQKTKDKGQKTKV